MPNYTLEQGRAVAEKIRVTTERMKIKQRNKDTFVDQPTTSLGVALYNNGESADLFIERTDRSLYKAKEGGRNRVVAEHAPE